MRRSSFFSRALVLAGFLGLGFVAGCDSGNDEMSLAAAQRIAVMNACGLNDGTIEDDADLRACDPANTKKTTVCHVPPGNPANAHTICIGNAAVNKHLHNHDDYLGPCKREIPCPPPGGTGGSPGGTGGSETPPGTGGMSGGTGGTATPVGTGGAGGAGGAGPVVE